MHAKRNIIRISGMQEIAKDTRILDLPHKKSNYIRLKGKLCKNSRTGY